ncbi:hypothetical protein FB451DRAFT_1376050 [Mycena latifolia]|nr:hypothetical protein FB451DRAFT_1376050 [Mycena latifolia]
MAAPRSRRRLHSQAGPANFRTRTNFPNAHSRGTCRPVIAEPLCDPGVIVAVNTRVSPDRSPSPLGPCSSRLSSAPPHAFPVKTRQRGRPPHFTGGSPPAHVRTPFANKVERRLRAVALNVWDDADSKSGGAESEMVVEVEVTESMCNVTTVAVLVLLSLAKGFDGVGLSQSMNVHWHHPAPLGTTLTITTRSVFADGRARLARCEMRDKASGRLVVSGAHAFLNAGRATRL